MASKTMIFLRRPLHPNIRLGMALVASVLLHALLLSSVSAYSVHGNVFARPVHAPLSVRIETLPESPEAAPIVINNKKALLRRNLNAPKPVPTTVPADIEPVLSQPGVSVSDTLYVRPIPRRASSPLLAGGEYLRSSDFSERPEAVALRIPPYPRSAREQRQSGWVIVMLFVDERGKVVDAAAVESTESFNEYEREVAEQLRGSTFTPGKRDGKEVKTLTFVRVRFDSRDLPDAEIDKRTGAPVSVENEDKP